MKHTAGPWERDSIDKYPVVIQTGYVMEPLGQLTICTVATQALETEANAHLIAAAPDLLEALKAIAENVVHAAPGSHARDIARAQAAIAKAEGR